MPYTKRVAGKLWNFQPITKIFTRNNLTIGRDGNGRVETITISDGTHSKLMTISRDGNNKISGITTT